MVILFKSLFIILWIVLVIIFLVGVIYQILMIKNRKSGIKLFDSKILFNPFNTQFFGNKYLTDKGLYWRNKSWLFLIIFLLIIILFLMIGFLFG